MDDWPCHESRTSSISAAVSTHGQSTGCPCNDGRHSYHHTRSRIHPNTEYRPKSLGYSIQYCCSKGVVNVYDSMGCGLDRRAKKAVACLLFHEGISIKIQCVCTQTIRVWWLWTICYGQCNSQMFWTWTNRVYVGADIDEKPSRNVFSTSNHGDFHVMEKTTGHKIWKTLMLPIYCHCRRPDRGSNMM